MDAAAPQLQLQPSRPKKRTGTSKYDFIKVKVWLGDNLDHYYILSRFLICRMLTVTRIPYIKAVKIALETKKHLVDNNLHDVTQAQLEEVLFSIVRDKGFDEAHIDCYRMVTQFYQSRQPLCIIICGAAWTGKSTLAQQLAARINIPNVMQTDVIYELLRAGPDSPLHPVPLWARPGLAGGRCCDAALVREFRREARVVREGMEGDLIKTLSDGKPIIIEGLHLDPGLYIPDLGSRGLILLPARPTAAMAAAAVVAAGGGLHAAAAAGRSPGSSPLAGRGRYGRCQTLPARASAAAADAVGVGGGAADASQQQEEQQEQEQEQRGKLEVRQGGGQDTRQQQRQQQQALAALATRRASASAEVSVSAAGPLSPGSLVQSGDSVTAEAAMGLLKSSTAGTYSHQQQPQPEQQSQQEQQLPSLPPLPPLRLHRRHHQQQQQSVATAPILNGHAGRATTSSSGGNSTVLQDRLHSGVYNNPLEPSVQQRVASQQQRKGSPFADAAAAAACLSTPAAAAAAAGAAATAGGPIGLLCSPDELPVAMTAEEVQVCAAAAEAAALQQHRQELQASQQQQLQQQQQHGRQAPGSPFSSASDVSSLGVGGGSPPCMSQEHSTTEVVSRVCSCASLSSPALTLSQEPSGAELWSPAAAGAGSAGADGLGCGALMCRQLIGGGMLRSGGFHTRSSPRVSSRQLTLGLLPEEQPVERLPQQSQAQQKQRQPSLPMLPDQPLQQQRQQHSGCSGATSLAQSSDQQQADAGCVSAPAGGQSEALSAADGAAAAAVSQATPHCTSPGAVHADGVAAAQPPPDAAAASTGADGAGGWQAPAQQVVAAANGTAAQPAAVAQAQPQPQPHQHPQVPPQQQAAAAQVEPGSGSGVGGAQAAASELSVGKPLFVPILVYMDEADHALMADEALGHLGLPAGKAAAAAGADGGGDGTGSNSLAGGQAAANGGGGCMHEGEEAAWQQHQGGVTVDEALRRVRLLQEYLCAYEAQGLPVVKVSYGAFGEALDKLHEYVLQCIKLAMQSRMAATPSG